MLTSALGTIVHIDDDVDDQLLLQTVLEALTLSDLFRPFSDGEQALAYLESTLENPFLILFDMHLPKVGGIEFEKLFEASNNPLIKSIPFVFFSSSVDPRLVSEAYHHSVQGFVAKPIPYGQHKECIRTIVTYWKINEYHR